MRILVLRKFRLAYGVSVCLCALVNGGSIASARVTGEAPKLHVCLPNTYGASADGLTDDTHAFQAAVDACAAHGGGTVRLQHGKFLTGPVLLRSNISLQIDADATLLGSQKIEDYPILAGGDRRQALIASSNAVNVRIIGAGTIDGQGAPWWSVHKSDKKAGRERKPRPWLIDLFKTRHILVEGITLKNSPEYNLVIRSSTDAIVRRIRIVNPPDAANTDGIDPY